MKTLKSILTAFFIIALVSTGLTESAILVHPSLAQADSTGLSHVVINFLTKDVTHNIGISEDVWTLLVGIAVYILHLYKNSALKKRIADLEQKLLNATK